jgi:hypothetical protein
VNNSGNSANTNVTSANIQVNPEIRARNESTNVVVSHNENESRNENDNDNRNDADADADARARNVNGNLSVGVNAVENANANSNTNSPTSTDSNTNTSSNTSTNTNASTNNNPPVPFAASRATCESYGGVFAVGTGSTRWTCTNLATLSGAAFDERFEDLASACRADGGSLIQIGSPPPQNATCGPPPPV